MRHWTTGTSIEVLGDELVVVKRRTPLGPSPAAGRRSTVEDDLARSTEAEAAWLLAARGAAVAAVRRVDTVDGLLVTALAGQHTLRTVRHGPAATATVLAALATALARIHRLGLVHGGLTIDHVVVTGPSLTEPVLCSPKPSLPTPSPPGALPTAAATAMAGTDLAALAAMAARLGPIGRRQAHRWRRVIDELHHRGPLIGASGAAELFLSLA